jgi:hypothetical protein
MVARFQQFARFGLRSTAARRNWPIVAGLVVLSLVLSSVASLAAPTEPGPKSAPLSTPPVGGIHSQSVAPQAISGAVQSLTGCGTTTLGPQDDSGSLQGTLGFTLNFFGQNYTKVWVNNNGNITFDGSNETYTPEAIVGNGMRIIAPFWADVDTRGTASGKVTFGQTSVDGRPAFCVNWPNVGYYDVETNKLNSFQLLLVDRSNTGAGNFDLVLNYDSIQWETGDAVSSGGSNGLGGHSTRVGYSNGTQAKSLELTGSGVNGALINGGPNALATHSLGSGIAGRYIFTVRGGNAPVGAIVGTVRNQALTPLANSVVYACSVTFCQTTTSGANGQYSINGLPDGPYGVTAFPPPGVNNLLNGDVNNLTIANGQTLQPIDPILPTVQTPPAGTGITPLLNTQLFGGNVVPWNQPLTLVAGGPNNCPNVTFQITLNATSAVIASGSLVQGPLGTYSATVPTLQPVHGPATVTIDFHGCQPNITFSIYIDPSGFVRDQNGTAIAGATVTLLYSDVQTGPFNPVADGSALMSESNRHNPDTTDALGFFHWDVAPGFYKVRAQKAGCNAPGNPGQAFNETGVLQIPPPALGLDLRLDCPAALTATVTRTSTATRTITPTITRTATATLTLTPATGSLGGGVTLQGRPAPPNPLQQRQLTVTLYLAADSSLVGSHLVTTDTSGNFTLSGIPSGTYHVRIKDPLALSRLVKNLFVSNGATSQFGSQTVPVGDSDNNDQIDIVDFSLLRSVFGTSPTCGTALPVPGNCADYDGSGQIDIVDFSLLRSSFGQSGPALT